jgi:hypothetical protein
VVDGGRHQPIVLAGGLVEQLPDDRGSAGPTARDMTEADAASDERQMIPPFESDERRAIGFG